ncbi:unnamed protein product [Notodromas monacha]|uniref:Uncharacterized protein n=1 Tax=Notodromas monacha TaxID=399045 RepID=A0A7R9BLG7_9CRUS|nr:unnamed protein product [Notodromas monacha]CAG0917668.1 unnamed protein product [Notodromas monacha]
MNPSGLTKSLPFYFHQGVVCGISTLLLSCFGGGLTSGRAQAILLMSISVGCCNAVNMIVMEIGEWRIFDHDRNARPDPHLATFHGDSHHFHQTSTLSAGNNGTFGSEHRRDTMSMPAGDPDPFTAEVVKSLLSYAYLTTTISTAAALVSSFIASQYILCFMYRNEKNKQAGHPDAFRSTIRNPEDEAPGLASPWLQRQETACRQYAMWMDKLYLEQNAPGYPQHTGAATSIAMHREHVRALQDAMDRADPLRYARRDSFSSTTTLGSTYSSSRSVQSTRRKPPRLPLAGIPDPDYDNLKRLHDAYYAGRITQGLPGVPGLGPSLSRSNSSDSSTRGTRAALGINQAINSTPKHTPSATSPHSLIPNVSQDRLLLVPAEQLQPSSTSSSANSSISGTFSQQHQRPERPKKTSSYPRDHCAQNALPSVVPGAAAQQQEAVPFGNAESCRFTGKYKAVAEIEI